MSGRKAGRREERWRKSWLEDEEEEEDDDDDSGGREVPKGTTDADGRTERRTDDGDEKNGRSQHRSLARCSRTHEGHEEDGAEGRAHARSSSSFSFLLLGLAGKNSALPKDERTCDNAKLSECDPLSLSLTTPRSTLHR